MDEQLFDKLEFSQHFIDDLEIVSENPVETLPIFKQIILKEVHSISSHINFVLFRQIEKQTLPVACTINNVSHVLTESDIAEIHHNLWLYGKIPLLYVNNFDAVYIFSCLSKKAVSKQNHWIFKPSEVLTFGANIEEKIAQYKASNLITREFWESEQNRHLFSFDVSAHTVLINKIIKADKSLDGEHNPSVRRLLLLTILIKYLEDRGVFATEDNWFSQFVPNATSFYDVLCSQNISALLNMFHVLQEKFNGDIFNLIYENSLTSEQLKSIADIVEAKSDENGQLYFWDIYSFKYIPVEVLSHIYQYFSQPQKGAVFTPAFLVDLMLDSVFPYDNIKGTETVFDPTCGSGIFLVSAFRRLIFKNLQKNNWKKLSPAQLKEILRNSIFGIELQEEAAHITEFSLALAICDALVPDIIWNSLRFDKMTNRNIFIGDFAEIGKLLLEEHPHGFDLVVGNPPFLSRLTKPMLENAKNNKIKFSDNQIAYYILYFSCKDFLSSSGKLCMIQQYNFLYNQKSHNFRNLFFSEFSVESIFDFISIRGLFNDADTKIITIIANKQKPLENEKIQHITFRRTYSVKNHICFELDHYDYNVVQLVDALKYDFVWKANLLGGGRLLSLLKYVSDYKTLGDFFNEKKWLVGEGFIVGKGSKNQIKCDWLAEKPFLKSKTLCDDEINLAGLCKLEENYFVSPHAKELYEAPLVIIGEHSSLPIGILKKGSVSYTHEYIGIVAKSTELQTLENFFNQFVQMKSVLIPLVYLLGGRAMTSKALATQKSDILALPWSENGDYGLTQTDKILLSDVSDYMADYVRLGQDAFIARKNASNDDIEKYCSVFLKFMKTVYPDFASGKTYVSDDFVIQEFSFEGTLGNHFDFYGDLKSQIKKLLTVKQSALLQKNRVIQVFFDDSIYFIKPNKLRYWLQSVAIRDADDVCALIMRGGK